MNIDLSVKILGDKEFMNKVKELNDKQLDKALRRTVTKTNTSVRKSIRTEVRTHYTLTAKRIIKDMPKTIFRRNGTEANIRTGEKPITLRAYGGRMTRKGYSASPLKGQRQIINRSFTIKPNKVTLPFMRVGRKNYPIRGALKGPSLHAIVTTGSRSSKIQKQVLNTGDTRFLQVMKGEVDAVLRGF